MVVLLAQDEDNTSWERILNDFLTPQPLRAADGPIPIPQPYSCAMEQHPGVSYDVAIKHSRKLPGDPAGAPGPLEIEAAEMTGDIHHFADKIESGHLFGFHGLGG